MEPGGLADLDIFRNNIAFHQESMMKSGEKKSWTNEASLSEKFPGE